MSREKHIVDRAAFVVLDCNLNQELKKKKSYLHKIFIAWVCTLQK